MRTGISITVSAADGKRFQAVFRDRNVAQKHAWRAMPTSERDDNFLRFGRPGKGLGPAAVPDATDEKVWRIYFVDFGP
jgi:hypothetical protein